MLPHPNPDQQSALRFFPGADSHGQRRRATRSPSRARGTWAKSRKFILFIGPISSIFDYTTFCVMWFYLQMQPISAWCRRRNWPRVLPMPPIRTTLTPPRCFNTGWFVESHHDADAHHPRHPHEPDSVHPVARELAADDDHHSDHGHRRVSAVFAAGASRWASCRCRGNSGRFWS